MPRNVTITFDAADPFALAEFWKLALGYQDVPPPPGHDSWRSFGEIMALRDPEGVRPELLFLAVPEGKVAKNRAHLDIEVGERPNGPKTPEYQAAMAELAKELVAAGATEVGPCSDFGSTWIVMADPEGNEFCVV